MNIQIPFDELMADRTSELVELLSPITNNRNLNIVLQSRRNSIAFIASNTYQNTLDLRDYRFSTICASLKAAYYEIWHQVEVGIYYLERAYLHLYLNDDEYLRVREDGEYILLHCDPNEDNNSPHAKYKQSPHIHVECAQYPISKAHFALCNGILADVLQNKESITRALTDAIVMIKEEIIDKLNE